ncbi:MAG: NADH-quinone oxidoreductase subunit NuoE [Dehalococcoidia bacterium]
MDQKRLRQIVDKYADQEGALIQLLLDIQKEFNWVPKEAIQQISETLDIPLSQIYRVASFYNSVSLRPRGKHIVNVCLGTACQVRDGPRVMDRVSDVLGIEAGETTSDMKFTLERVNCLGCCALGPVMVVDGEYHGKVMPSKAEEILKSYD